MQSTEREETLLFVDDNHLQGLIQKIRAVSDICQKWHFF